MSFKSHVCLCDTIVFLHDKAIQETAELFICAVSPQIIGRSLVRHHSVVHKKDLIRDFHCTIHFMRYYQHTAPLLVGQILNDRQNLSHL